MMVLWSVLNPTKHPDRLGPGLGRAVLITQAGVHLLILAIRQGE